MPLLAPHDHGLGNQTLCQVATARGRKVCVCVCVPGLLPWVRTILMSSYPPIGYRKDAKIYINVCMSAKKGSLIRRAPFQDTILIRTQ